MKLLLVEDEKRMAAALMEVLRLEKYEVDLETEGISGGIAAESGLYDLIILDVMLPGKSSFDIAKEVRRAGIRTPILMLTARGELDDKVMGLDCGADDYLVKPFQVKELLARLRALGRRAMNRTGERASFGDLSLDAGSSFLWCTTNGKSVRLREKECRVMEYLMANQGQILSREQLALKIWGYESEAEYNNVEVYLSFTRKKLAAIGSAVKIKAVRGLGYELRDASLGKGNVQKERQAKS